MINPVQIVINGGTKQIDELLLCLQGIVANTILDKVTIFVYTKNNLINQKEIIDYLGIQVKVEVYNIDTDLWSNIVADAVEKLPKNWEMVLLSSEAVPSSGWLESLSEVAARDDVGLVTSREIRQGTDCLAWELVPFTSSLHDIDVALSPQDNLVLNPGFDESKILVELSSFKLFCVFLSEKVLSSIAYNRLVGMQNQDWLDYFANTVRKLHQQAIVYTPKVSMYHSRYLTH